MNIILSLENKKNVSINLQPLINFLNAKSEQQPDKTGQECIKITEIILDSIAKTDPQLASDAAEALVLMIKSTKAVV